MSESFLWENAMQMPNDVTDGAIILRTQGREELWLENYRTLTEYTDQNIRVIGRHAEVHIYGEHMRIDYYGSEDMKITGVVSKIEFV